MSARSVLNAWLFLRSTTFRSTEARQGQAEEEHNCQCAYVYRGALAALGGYTPPMAPAFRGPWASYGV